MPSHQHTLLLPLTLALAASSASAADCTCGYTINTTRAPDHALFTDLLESDFLHTYDFSPASARGMRWRPQTYDQRGAGGPCGMAKAAANVVANPLRRIWDWGGEEGVGGGDPGLQLWVRGEVVGGEGEGLVPTAEVVSVREDVLYGSFRIAMKTTGVNGTCAAFFFYRNDTQEIDVEILSAQQFASRHQWPVNLVVQNTSTPLALNGSGPRSSNMEFHMVQQPDGAVGGMFHEYRFDWLPDRIDFYVDAWHTHTVTDNVPSSPGAIHFSHWSDGNPGWAHGPPAEDAVMTVAYVKAYFNTTSAPPLSGHDCSSPEWRDASDAVCRVPDQHASPWPGGPMGNETGRTFFFSRGASVAHNMTEEGGHEHTIHDPREGGANAISTMRQKALWTLVAVVAVPVASALLYRFL